MKMKIFLAISALIIQSAAAVHSNDNVRTRFLDRKTGKASKNSKATNPCATIVAAEIGWSNWYHSVETFAPVFRVKTDQELRDIIKASRKEDHGKTRCTVRPFGSTHTYDGMVMQRTEEDAVLVSLVDHTPDDEAWAPNVDVATGRVRLLAGQSWYDAVALYRHHGLIMPERTLGRFFSVGGVIANAVHGGSKEGGFVHSHVTKMLVMTSDGKTSEIKGDTLKYWRSSGGQLGVILAVEIQLVREADKGGTLAMKNDIQDFSSLFADVNSPTVGEVYDLVSAVTQKVYSTIAAYDHNEFFFNYYSNQLASFYTDFSGPPFNEALASKYEAAAQFNLEAFGQDVSYTGGSSVKIPDDLCGFLCNPGTGNPPTGDGSTPCVPVTIPNSNELVCNNPLATAAAFAQTSITSIKESYESTAQSVNDGYFGHYVTDHKYLAIIIPSRAFSTVFATWWAIHSKAIQLYHTPGSAFQYIPNNVLEFRFISPTETAALNPVQPFSEVKADFDKQNMNSFDSFFPPIQGIPDGLISMEVININGVNDDDHAKYFASLEQAWHNLPSNPLAPWGNNTDPSYGPIVPECDASKSIVPCASVNNNNLPPFANPANGLLPCCNPPVPVNVHIAKEYAFGVDVETTPTTGQPVPFHDDSILKKVFASTEKSASVIEFNAVVKKYDAEVFQGGSLLRWLSPSDSHGFEPRSLTGQTCGSEEYANNPSSECVSNQCDTVKNTCL